MLRMFNGQTADEVWQRIASTFRSGDGIKEQPSRAGPTREILHAAISVANPLLRWVPSRKPPINPAFAIAEIVWIMTGRKDSAFLNYFNRELPKYAGEDNAYHGAYGHRLRCHLGFDQLEHAYCALKQKPYSRQVVLQIWDSRVDLPGLDGEESAPDVPCNIMSMLKVRSGKLEWMQIIRSSDVYRGLPYDFVQFTTLQEVIGGWLGLELGSYHLIADSLHVYNDCLGHINASSPIEVAQNTDSLALPKEESEKTFNALGHQIDMITNPDVSADELASVLRRSRFPQAFRNMHCVLSAEGVRRRRRPDLIDQIMAECTNPAYKQLFQLWLARFSGAQSTASKHLSVDH
ncbi:MAG: thymidylate synthase [Candidatus Binatia bacterium]